MRETVNPVASIQKRPRKDGSTAFSVAFRVDGKQRRRTFDTEEEAARFAETQRPGGGLRVTSVKVVDLDPVKRRAVVHLTLDWS